MVVGKSVEVKGMIRKWSRGRKINRIDNSVLLSIPIQLFPSRTERSKRNKNK